MRGDLKGQTFRFYKNTNFPTKFSDDFLSSNQNKQNLNIFLANYFMEIHENEEQILVVTLYEGIVSSSDEL